MKVSVFVDSAVVMLKDEILGVITGRWDFVRVYIVSIMIWRRRM